MRIELLVIPNEQDSQDIEVLVNELFCNRYAKTVPSDFWKYLISSPYYYIIVVRNEDDRIIGMVSLIITQTLSRKVAHYEELCILPAYRGFHISNMLTEEFLKLARKFDVDCVELTVDQDNEIAQNLYLKYGLTVRNQLAMGKIFKRWTTRSGS
jgi:ribosomal protein S18 acetylase RimI-like enzyme